MYEHHLKPLISRRAFFRRLLAHGALVFGVVSLSLFVGTYGYHTLARLPWIDAFLNASMIMGGMGPVDVLRTNASKLFAALYALYSGLVLLVSVGILFAPVLHRILHHLHVADKID